MLKITIPETELFDEYSETFHIVKEQTINLEHSLVSLSKWEMKWNKPFMTDDEKSTEEVIDYIRCMTMTQNVDPLAYKCLNKENFDKVNAYIKAPMTATWFNEDKKVSRNKEIVTSELIYYWMIALNIPFECQKWHLNRLLTLIRVCNIKNAPPKKMSKAAILNRNRALNEARKKQMHTQG